MFCFFGGPCPVKIPGRWFSAVWVVCGFGAPSIFVSRLVSSELRVVAWLVICSFLWRHCMFSSDCHREAACSGTTKHNSGFCLFNNVTVSNEAFCLGFGFAASTCHMIPLPRFAYCLSTRMAGIDSFASEGDRRDEFVQEAPYWWLSMWGPYFEGTWASCLLPLSMIWT